MFTNATRSRVPSESLGVAISAAFLGTGLVPDGLGEYRDAALATLVSLENVELRSPRARVSRWPDFTGLIGEFARGASRGPDYTEFVRHFGGRCD